MKKIVTFPVRMTMEERCKLEEKAKVSNTTKSELLRKFINDEKIMVYDMEAIGAMKSLCNEVNKIGVNINQIVRNENMHYYSEYEKKKLFALQQKMLEQLTDIQDKFYQ